MKNLLSKGDGKGEFTGDCPMYRSRRTWLMVDGILAYVAICSGISGWLFVNGTLHQLLRRNGEAVGWGFFFCTLGIILMAAVLWETSFRKKFEQMIRDSGYNFGKPEEWPWRVQELERRVLKRFAEARKLLDFGMAACWIIAFLLLLDLWIEPGDDSKIALTFLMAPAWIVLHIRGGWEHVKTCRFKPQFDRDATFVGFVGDSIRRGIGGPKG